MASRGSGSCRGSVCLRLKWLGSTVTRVGKYRSFAVDTIELLERMKGDLDAARIPNDGIHDEPALNAKGLLLYDPDGIAVELYTILK